MKNLYLIIPSSLPTGRLPDDWKNAYVVPVHEGGLKKDAANYIPISLTSIPCKVMEHILNTNIMGHTTNHILLLRKEYGFRKGLS